MLSNLIVNASEYSFDNSVIDIIVEKLEGNFKITVSDTGLGIQSNDISTLFKKYSTNSKDYRKVGTGLGLYICRAIVNAHGGTIEASRPKNGGMSFSFTISLDTPKDSNAKSGSMYDADFDNKTGGNSNTDDI